MLVDIQRDQSVSHYISISALMGIKTLYKCEKYHPFGINKNYTRSFKLYPIASGEDHFSE